jgi:acetate---CoA ligase (ADP-forming)
VVAGLGGVYAEIFNDVALAIPSVHTAKAMDSLKRLRSYRLLEGVRGEPPSDVRAFADVLVRLGRLAETLGDRLLEVDINPLFVFAEGEGVLAADALVVLR